MSMISPRSLAHAFESWRGRHLGFRRAISPLASGAVLTLINPQSARAQTVTATLAAGSQPCAVAVNPVTNTVYVANYYGGDLTVIDGATNRGATVAAGTNPCAIGANWVTNKIYVANFNSQDVTVIDGATNSTITVTAPEKSKLDSLNVERLGHSNNSNVRPYTYSVGNTL